jgi:hypothetical protein
MTLVSLTSNENEELTDTDGGTLAINCDTVKMKGFTCVFHSHLGQLYQ